MKTLFAILLLAACGEEGLPPISNFEAFSEDCCRCLTTVIDGNCAKGVDPEDCDEGPTIHTSCECVNECAEVCGHRRCEGT